MAQQFQLVSPVDGSTVAERAAATASELRDSIAQARRAQADWRHQSIASKAQHCGAFVDAMLAMRDDIVPELAWQMGRPVAFGPGELRGFEERSRHMISIAATELADITPAPIDGFERFIAREPMGLVLVIAPWNYPLLTAVNTIVPALMAGNAVLLKHASQTLLTGERFQMAACAAGLPDGLFTNLLLSHEQTSTLLAQGQIDQVNFTGSVPGGRSIEASVAGTFTGVGLELGGKDPAYVRADADLAHALDNIVDGSFFNSGQSCCGIERVYVHRSRYIEFVERAVELTHGYVLGNPLDPSTTLGPMVHGRAADTVRDQVNAARAAGARTLIDPGLFGGDTAGSAYLPPQILIDVDHTMAIMREESFGPVIGIMPVDSDDEAVTLMNDSDFGLTASIWTQDADAVRQLGPRIETGTVFMNRADFLDPALAWTGVKDTGRGITLSALGYSTLTRPKSYHLRLAT